MTEASHPLAALATRALTRIEARAGLLAAGACAIGACAAGLGLTIGFVLSGGAALWTGGSWLLLLLGVGAASAALGAGVFVLARRVMAPVRSLTEAIRRAGDARGFEAFATDGDSVFAELAAALNALMARDRTAIQRAQAMAFIDPETQLPNRESFLRDLDYFCLRPSKTKELGGVILIEFARVAEIMRTLDHAQALDLARALAERVNASLGGERARAGVAHRVARMAADEFAVFCAPLTAAEDAVRLAQSMSATLNQAIEWRGQKFLFQASCGVAIAPRDGASGEAIVRAAKMALNAARGATARLKVFTRSLDRDAVARLSLERELREALENNEFRAHFQPKVRFSDGRVTGAEALARWIRADKSTVSPARFIPIAEESGMIGPLSEAILREACWKAASWARAGLEASVAVNVSPLQFRDERFAERVLRIVSHAGLSPSALELEITESTAIEDPERTSDIVGKLRAAGIRMAIDDFGCGHSSIAALSRLPFDMIKIDQHFIRGLLRGEAHAEAIVDMILALASSLKLDVIAEGIEQEAQARFVEARGCQYGQGFLYGAAIPAADFAAVLMRKGVRRTLDEAREHPESFDAPRAAVA